MTPARAERGTNKTGRGAKVGAAGPGGVLVLAAERRSGEPRYQTRRAQGSSR